MKAPWGDKLSSFYSRSDEARNKSLMSMQNNPQERSRTTAACRNTVMYGSLVS